MRKRAVSSISMESVKSILKSFDPTKDKYISREFQSYGYYLASELSDLRHISLYIKLAKDVPRAILEKALSFVKDARARSKGRLFMWKLKDLGAFKKSQISNLKSQKFTTGAEQDSNVKNG